MRSIKPRNTIVCCLCGERVVVDTWEEDTLVNVDRPDTCNEVNEALLADTLPRYARPDT